MPTTLKNDFDEFLFAPVSQDASGAPVSLLTALARLNIDGWEEAEVLARMSTDAATTKLAGLLSQPPNDAAPDESVTIAKRLVVLLHRRPTVKARYSAPPPLTATTIRAWKLDPSIFYFVGSITVAVLIFIVIWRWANAGPQ
jgi:hypothetical protein